MLPPPQVGEQATVQLSECPLGVFLRQLFLGDALDTDRIDAVYDNGVLVVKIPIAEKVKLRKVSVIGRPVGEHKVISS